MTNMHVASFDIGFWFVTPSLNGILVTNVIPLNTVDDLIRVKTKPVSAIGVRT